MSLPKFVYIQGHKTLIKQTAALEDTEGKDTLGMADLLDHVIHIHKDMSPQAKRRILLHEATHHALWRNGLSQSISPELEEVMCQTFAYLYEELKGQGI